MKRQTVEHIDNRIARLKLIRKRLLAERRVAVLREQHRKLKTTDQRGANHVKE